MVVLYRSLSWVSFRGPLCRSLSYVLCRFLSWVCCIGLCHGSLSLVFCVGLFRMFCVGFFHGCVVQVFVMGWLRLAGSLKLLVFFAKEPYKRDDILQKRRIILRGLRIVATPYESFCQLSVISLCYLMGCRSLSCVLCRSLSWVCCIGLCYSLLNQLSGISLCYVVATISRLLKRLGLFRRI